MSFSLPEREGPPSKKARTSSYAGNRPDMDTSHSLFLDTFPIDVFENILRFFSRVPQARDWVRFIPLQSIVGLYGVTGELGQFMKPRFHTLCISKWVHTEYASRCMKWKKREGPMLVTDDLDAAYRFVLAGGGQALHTIIIYPDIYHGGNKTEIAEDFYNNCPNVKSLSIKDPKGAWVSRFGDQLEELEIEIDIKETSVIAENCLNLRELNLRTRNYNITKELEGMWKSIGSKLKCLTIQGYGLRGEYIQYIETHCRELRRICIYGMKSFNGELSVLLASYGDQLEYCHVDNMTKSELTTITNECNKVRFSAAISDLGLLCDTLKVLKDKLDEIYVSCNTNPDSDDLRNAWNDCVNLRDFDIWICAIEHAKALMATPKKAIKNLTFGIRDDKDAKEMMSILSKGTGSVEEFEFMKWRPQELPKDTFDNFISGNKTSLRKFSGSGLYVHNIPPGSLDALFTLLINCPNLEYVSGLAFSQNQVKSFQRRGISCCDRFGKPWC